jgi:cytochrome c-type protein NapC
MGAAQGKRFARMPQLPQRAVDAYRQAAAARRRGQRSLFTGQKTCIDCHKGIAHRLPDMRGVPGGNSNPASAIRRT